MKNPLLESLMRQAKMYENSIFEEGEGDKTVKKTKFSEFVNYLSETGRNMVQAYQAAIGTYPATEYKNTYMASMPDKIRAIAKTVGTSTGDKTINSQLDLLLDGIKKELNEFLEGSKKDEGYAQYLLGWRNALQKGFNQYELAIRSIEKYVKSQEDLGKAKMEDKDFAALGNSLEKVASSMEDEIATLKIANQGVENSSYNFKDSKQALVESFMQTNLLVNFSKFVEIINEGKGKERRQAKREAKQIIEDCNNLKAQINSVVVLIASRESYHGGETNKFKSSEMNTQFADIAKKMDGIIDQIEGKDKKELATMDLSQLSDEYEKYETLFGDLKEKYDNSYTEEYTKIKSIDVVNTASPEVAKYIETANSFFNSLSSLSLDAQRQKTAGDKTKAESDKKAKEDEENKKKSEASKVKISNPVKYESGKSGEVNDDVKKVQQLIIDKLGKKLSDDDAFKRFSKYGADGKFGQNTRNIISAVKAGLGMSDTSSDVTQEFIDKLSEVKESFSYIREDFDVGAYQKKIKSAPVVKKSVAKSKSADKKEDKPVDKKEEPKEEVKIDVEKVSQEAEDMLIRASESIQSLFATSDFWSEFKGTFNDDEDEAKEAFGEWWDLQIDKKILQKVITKIESLPDGDEKETLNKSVSALQKLRSSIDTKIEGDTSDDTAYWKMYKLDGTVTSYKVDTDF